jgi:hypothetical protein
MHKALAVRSEVGRAHSSKDARNERRAKGHDWRSATLNTRSSAWRVSPLRTTRITFPNKECR